MTTTFCCVCVCFEEEEKERKNEYNFQSSMHTCAFQTRPHPGSPLDAIELSAGWTSLYFRDHTLFFSYSLLMAPLI